MEVRIRPEAREVIGQQLNVSTAALDRSFAGDTAEAVVAEIKKAFADLLPFPSRMALNLASPLFFGQRVVQGYSEARKKSLPVPRSCTEFLQQCEAEGIITIMTR